MPVSSTFFYLAPWVIFLPALGLLVNLLVGKRMGDRGAGSRRTGLRIGHRDPVSPGCKICG